MRNSMAALLALCLITLAVPARAEKQSMGPFGEKVVFRFGVMWATQDTQLRLDGDSGLGVGVDLEDFFELDEEASGVAQFMVMGRIKDRHRIGLQYYMLGRDSTSTLQEKWEGDNITAEPNARADTEFNISVYDLSYAYSFIRDEKHELAGTIGLFTLGLDFSLDLEGDITVDGEQSMSGTASVSERLPAPLPVFGLNYTYAATPRWLTTVAFQYFTIRTNKLSGSLVRVSADTRYYFWDHFEVGGGFSVFDLGVDWDGGDLGGRVDWSFWGPQLFLGARF